jgi:hypothetical protein
LGLRLHVEDHRDDQELAGLLLVVVLGNPCFGLDRAVVLDLAGDAPSFPLRTAIPSSIEPEAGQVNAIWRRYARSPPSGGRFWFRV